MFEFKWIPWSLDKLAKHGVSGEDVEYVVNHARRPFPQRIDNDKVLVWGQARAGRYLQVVYVIEEDGSLFVIHARELTAAEKRRFRKRAREH